MVDRAGLEHERLAPLERAARAAELDHAADRHDRHRSVLAPGGLDLRTSPGGRARARARCAASRASRRPARRSAAEARPWCRHRRAGARTRAARSQLGALLLGLEQHGLLERDRGAVGEPLEQAQTLVGEVGQARGRSPHGDPAANAVVRPAAARLRTPGGSIPSASAAKICVDLARVEQEGRLAAVDKGRCRRPPDAKPDDAGRGRVVAHSRPRPDSGSSPRAGPRSRPSTASTPINLATVRTVSPPISSAVEWASETTSANSSHAFALSASRRRDVVEAGVLERDRRVTGEHLEQAEIVLVELADRRAWTS